MEVRAFNREGTQKFENWLSQMKNDTISDLPDELIREDNLTQPVEGAESIELREFANKRELGEYLFQKLKKSDLSNRGMWNWLAGFYLNQLCPLKNGKRKKPGNLNRYVITRSSYTSDDFRRHLIAMPVLFCKAYEGNDTVLNVILASGKIHQHGEFQEQPLATKEYYNCMPMLSAIGRLYYDDENKKLTPGAAGKDAGSIRRFIEVIGSIGYTHHFYSMKPEKILEILPKEFDKFK